MPDETILEEAARIVSGERQQDYGDQLESFERIAKAWSAVLPCDVTAEHVALCMVGLKIVRESHAHKRDNVVDIVGYGVCIDNIVNARAERGVDDNFKKYGEVVVEPSMVPKKNSEMSEDERRAKFLEEFAEWQSEHGTARGETWGIKKYDPTEEPFA